MDTRYQIPITKIDLKTLPYADLSRYTDIIIAGFGYGSSRISEGTVKKIKSFVQDGGSVIAYRNSANWLNTNGFLNLEFKRNSMVAKIFLLSKEMTLEVPKIQVVQFSKPI